MHFPSRDMYATPKSYDRRPLTSVHFPSRDMYATPKSYDKTPVHFPSRDMYATPTSYDRRPFSSVHFPSRDMYATPKSYDKTPFSSVHFPSRDMYETSKSYDRRPLTSVHFASQDMYATPNSYDETPFPDTRRRESFHSPRHGLTLEKSPAKVQKSACSDSNFIEEEIRIVLIGRTGSGKSAAGNTILGKKCFKSSTSGTSITKTCQVGKAFRLKQKILVVDTPGMFDTCTSNVDVTSELAGSIDLTYPGPHVFLFVIGVSRFTEEEQNIVRFFVDNFGSKFLRYAILLFTHRDELDTANMSIHDFVSNTPHILQQLLEQCQYRYLAFDNTLELETSNIQVKELFDKINKMILNNKRSFYTREMFEKAEERRFQNNQRQRQMEHRKKQEMYNSVQMQVDIEYEARLNTMRHKIIRQKEKSTILQKEIATLKKQRK